MKIRNFLAPFLIGVFALSCFGMGAVSVAESVAIVDSFSDVAGYQPAFKAIDYLREEGIVVGYSDGTFGVDNNINRAEFLKIVMEAGDYEAFGSDCYIDVIDEWFAPYVCAATEAGLVNGYPDGYFRPGREINFAEASKIVTGALGIEQIALGDTWFSPYVYALEATEAIPADISSFDQKLSRSDMAEMAWRIMTQATYKVSNTFENIAAGVPMPDRGGELMNFDSCVELQSYFEDNAEEPYIYAMPMMDMARGVEETMEMAVPAPTAAEDSGLGLGAGTEEFGGGGGGAEEYSATNVQVEGVDEADIVKNDNKYIYLLKGDTVRIVDAYPPGSMAELDQVTFGDDSFYPEEMYVDGDRLVVIGYSYSGEIFDDIMPRVGMPEIMPIFDSSLTKVYIFDITDRSDITPLRQLSFEGNYSSSRKVDSVVYLVVNQYQYYWPWNEGEEVLEEDLVPLYGDSGTGEVGPITMCGGVSYMPGVIDSTDYVIVAGIDVEDADSAISEQVIMGSSGDIYASRENLYIAEPKYAWFNWYEDSSEQEETYIHKFALDGVYTEYAGVGTVSGTILNQFSMDEHNGYFRIATTTGESWREDIPSTNNLYVLDESLNVVGSVEGLAPGEEIYSVRFMGDRAYMVTFERIDPLFVIDVSVPTNPAVLGELHIPGVSDYLHPFDENHLLGFGLETLSENEIEEAGFSWFQGLKVSMFDVTNVSAPVELHKMVIGDRGTQSPLLYDHKALLFDAERGFMAFPVLLAEIPQSVKDDLDLDAWVYGDNVYQGAYIFDVSVENGFNFRGRISHYADDAAGENFNYYYQYGESPNIDRILYLGNYFYTVSQAIVKANEMEGLAEAGIVELEPGDEEDGGRWPVPMPVEDIVF